MKYILLTAVSVASFLSGYTLRSEKQIESIQSDINHIAVAEITFSEINTALMLSHIHSSYSESTNLGNEAVTKLARLTYDALEKSKKFEQAERISIIKIKQESLFKIMEESPIQACIGVSPEDLISCHNQNYLK